MSEWWTYRLGSFLLFSPRTYHRLFELYNQALWPSQLLAVAIGAAIAALLLTHLAQRDRIVAGLLAIAWLWVAWAFLYERYTQINWIAPWIAAAFALQALLLVAFGIGGGLRLEAAGGVRGSMAAALFALVVVGYPLLAPLSGRAWTTAEVFGLAPDPTALGTLAVLALARGRSRGWLSAIPLAACALGALTQRAMREPEQFVIVSVVLLGLLIGFRRSSPTARSEPRRL